MPSAKPPDGIDRLFNQAESLIKTPADQLKIIGALISCVILCLPFAYFPAIPISAPKSSAPKSNRSLLSQLRVLPSPLTPASILPHIYGFAISTFFLTGLLKMYDGYAHLLGQVLGTWIICAIGLSSSDVKGRMVGWKWAWLVFGGLMGHLTVNHILRYVNGVPNGAVEITPTQMVLTMKLSSFAWNLFDGQNYVSTAPLDSYQAAHAYSRLPSLIEFLGFAFFPAGTLIGPNFTFASYENFLTRNSWTASEGKDEGKGGRKVIIPDGRFTVGLNRLVFGLVNLGLFAVLGAKFPYRKMYSDEFANSNYVYRFIFMQIAGFAARVKFYGAWKLAEAGFIVSGLGWDPAARTWTASRNIVMREVEGAQSFKQFLDNWNMNTSVWLREAVYKRVTKPGKKPGFNSKMATFGTSALWHGPHPAYFSTFLLGGFFSNLGVQLRRSVRPFCLPPGTLAPRPPKPVSSNGHSSSSPTNGSTAKLAPPTAAPTIPPHPLTPKYIWRKRAYDLIGNINTIIAINFAVVPFVIVDIGPTFAIWRALNFYGLWLAFAPLAFFAAGGAKALKVRLSKREKRWLANVDATKQGSPSTAKEEASAARREVEKYGEKETAAAAKSVNVAEAL